MRTHACARASRSTTFAQEVSVSVPHGEPHSSTRHHHVSDEADVEEAKSPRSSLEGSANWIVGRFL
jgi:hypothetical protein